MILTICLQRTVWRVSAKKRALLQVLELLRLIQCYKRTPNLCSIKCKPSGRCITPGGLRLPVPADVLVKQTFNFTYIVFLLLLSYSTKSGVECYISRSGTLVRLLATF